MEKNAKRRLAVSGRFKPGLFEEKEETVESGIVQGKYYLKTCIIALRTAEQMPALMPLCRRLVESGIGCQVLLSEEVPEGGLGCQALLSEEVPEEDSLCARQQEAARHSGLETKQGVLYLTDDPRVYAALAAAMPTDSGVPQSDPMPGVPGAPVCCHPSVLVYLHPGNREADFGDARYALEEPEDVEPEYLERVFRRCHNLPWEILSTKRCWLRETVEEDVDSFWKMYQDGELTRYTEGLYPTPQAERKYVGDYRRLVYSFYEFGVWTVLDRRSGAVVGRAGLSVREGYDLPELGFVIGREWQGRGLAEEVCRGILEYARESLGFERIQVLVHQENAASLHLCRKLGFREQPAPKTAGELLSARQSPEKDACPPCMVEMEQNGRRECFVYMIFEMPTPMGEV